jgi:hypothetical protein
MSTVAEIKAAIPSLTLEEREVVARYLHKGIDDVDRQLATDARSEIGIEGEVSKAWPVALQTQSGFILVVIPGLFMMLATL